MAASAMQAVISASGWGNAHRNFMREDRAAKRNGLRVKRKDLKSLNEPALTLPNFELTNFQPQNFELFSRLKVLWLKVGQLKVRRGEGHKLFQSPSSSRVTRPRS
jgi:hypothetical protein